MFPAFIAAAFIVAHLIEASFIHALPSPFFLFPLCMILGVLLIHRGHLFLGAIWLCLSGPMLAWFGFDQASFIAYLSISLLAIPLARRIFAQRSLYAMEGLGIVLFICFSMINILLAAIFGGDPKQEISQHFFTLLWLVLGLYIAFTMLIPLERFTKNFLRRREV